MCFAIFGGTALRISGGAVTGNAAVDGGVGGSGGVDGGVGGSGGVDGGVGGSGGVDGGVGGTGGGVDVGGRAGQSLSPAVTGVRITANRAGRGGDAGPGGYTGRAGFGGSGGGIAVYSETLTLGGSWVSANAAGAAGAGWSPWPGSGGGIDTLDARVTVVDGTVVTGNRPDNCGSAADVPGCVNVPVARAQRADPAAGRDLRVEGLTRAARAASVTAG
ncbi:hypothetical protein ACQPYE_20405 [Actinosynnema sp. CA-299493]